MRLVPDLKSAAGMVSIPKVGILSAPMGTTLLSGDTLAADALDIVARMISVGQPHRAVPLTGALCLAVACRVPGSVAHDLVRQGDLTRPVRIGHPSGSILVAGRSDPGWERPPRAVRDGVPDCPPAVPGRGAVRRDRSPAKINGLIDRAGAFQSAALRLSLV